MEPVLDPRVDIFVNHAEMYIDAVLKYLESTNNGIVSENGVFKIEKKVTKNAPRYLDAFAVFHSKSAISLVMSTGIDIYKECRDIIADNAAR